jgi:hypothetical protein
VVEQPAVNRLVAGSNPAPGANKIKHFEKSMKVPKALGVPPGYQRGKTYAPRRRSLTAEHTCSVGRTEMKILLLVSDDVRAYYSAALKWRGHQIITHDRGISRSENSADWTAAIKRYMECDGCLLVSDDPQMRGLADWFGNSGKPVWHQLADLPGVKARHSRLLYVLVPVLLLVVGALVIKQPWFREETKPPVAVEKPPVAVEEKPVEEKPPIASEVTPPVVDKANDAGPKADEPSGKNCEEELRRLADFFKTFADRIQSGEEPQSVVADMRQQEKRISAACPD